MYLLLIKDLKEGDIFYECESGINVKYQVICNPYRDGNGWRLQATCLGEVSLEYVVDGSLNEKDVFGEGFERGEMIEFFTSDGWEHYLHIYSSPQYLG